MTKSANNFNSGVTVQRSQYRQTLATKYKSVPYKKQITGQNLKQPISGEKKMHNRRERRILWEFALAIKKRT